MKHIMLDLETMGNGNNAAVVAIGACEFDPHGEDVSILATSRFYQQISLESAVTAGMQMDPSTVLWWLKQSDAARKSTFEGENIVPIGIACHQFAQWVAAVERNPKDIRVWGNGATFDNIIIRSAFKAVGLPLPWEFRGDRCYRTIADLLPKARQPAYVRSGTAHNALDDAVTQALYLQQCYKAMAI